MELRGNRCDSPDSEDFTQPVTSLEINRAQVLWAQPGDSAVKRLDLREEDVHGGLITLALAWGLRLCYSEIAGKCSFRERR